MELTKEQENWCRQALLQLKSKKEIDARSDFWKLSDEAALKDCVEALDWRIAHNVDASFIKSVNSTVICSAQPDAPMIWEMVLHYKCNAIVKLTTDSLNREYFPEQPGEKRTYGSISVSTKSQSHSRNGVTKRVLEVDSEEQTMTLELFQYPWPDFQVPRTVDPVLEIFEELYKVPSAVYLAHCRAGIGRSGSFVVIDHILRRILVAGDVAGATDVEKVLRELRQCRPGLVETVDQYWFLFRAVIAELEKLLELARKRRFDAEKKPYASRLEDVL